MSNRLAIAAEAKKIVFVPLGKLKKSPKNVRNVPHTKADIKALAASIAALGMLQNPVVEPELGPRGKPTGNYLVNAGEGRRLAQLLRVQRKEIDLGEPIRCVLDTEHNGTEISLAENAVRTDMHPADQYEAFAKLHTEDGMSAEDIAARFGVTAAAASEQEAQKVAGLKKQAMAEAAEAALKGKNWLPAVLRGEPHKAAA
jgi:ParB family chromosome partitioning protein